MERSELCCSNLYREETVRLILGEVWHPGGLGITETFGGHLQIRPNDLVLDVACGVGASTSFLAEKFGCRILGIDISEANAKEASKRANGNGNAIEFVVGDSHYMPLVKESMDKAILECVVSAFQHKDRALRELARVLKPKALIGMTDVIVEGTLPSELQSSWFQAFCVSGALSTDNYVRLLENNGLDPILRHDLRELTLEFIEDIRKKIFVAELLIGLGQLRASKEDLESARKLVSVARESVEDGKLSYGLFIARKRD